MVNNMPKIRKPVEPFGDVNILPKKDYIEAVVSVLMVPEIEGAQVGIAIDASSYLKEYYENPPAKDTIFQQSEYPNMLQSIPKTLSTYLTSFAGDGKNDLIFYSCGENGDFIEKIGTASEENLESLSISAPKNWGGKRRLLPGIKHFIQSLDPNKWTFLVFITDGGFEDFEEVKSYTKILGKSISEGKRSFIKFAFIGIGEETHRKKMEELDDLFEGENLTDPEGNDIDLWCHKWIHDMKMIEEIFAEIVSENTIVAPSGKVLDQDGKEIVFYADGLPGKLRFKLPPKSTSFTLEYPGGKIVQDITSALG